MRDWSRTPGTQVRLNHAAKRPKVGWEWLGLEHQKCRMKRHGMKIQHPCVEGIAIVSPQFFWPPIYKYKLKLYHAKRKLYSVSPALRNSTNFSGSSQNGKACRVLTSPHFKLFSEVTDHLNWNQREVPKPASTVCWYRGCVSTNGMSNFHICEGANNAERYKQVLELILSAKEQIFQGCPCLFQQGNAKSHSASFKQHGFVVKECECDSSLPAVQTRRPLKRIMDCKIWWQKPLSNWSW